MRGNQRPSQRSLAITLIIALLAIGQLPGACKAGLRKHKRFVIHVPFSIKTHHHTHTVYSHIHSGGTKQTVYKVLGYSTHGSASASSNGHGHVHGHVLGHGHGHGYASYGGSDGHGGLGAGHEHGHGEIVYDDMHGCDGHKHGDMIFNHYSRNDEDYPDVEEYVDEEQGDEWE